LLTIRPGIYPYYGCNIGCLNIYSSVFLRTLPYEIRDLFGLWSSVLRTSIGAYGYFIRSTEKYPESTTPYPGRERGGNQLWLGSFRLRYFDDAIGYYNCDIHIGEVDRLHD
jgi:hypothetical protein